jgi:NADPH:quinone reductase-like Zn-dependent oxidoreductase
MKAIVCTKYGPPDGLQLQEVEKPTPQDDEVRIRVYATTVTSGDVVLRSLPFLFWLLLRIMVGLRRKKNQGVS